MLQILFAGMAAILIWQGVAGVNGNPEVTKTPKSVAVACIVAGVILAVVALVGPTLLNSYVYGP